MRVILNERTACFPDVSQCLLEFVARRHKLNGLNGEIVKEKRLRITRTLHLSAIHSYLSAIIGSTFVARLAGMKHARNVINVRSTATPAKTSGSVVLTP